MKRGLHTSALFLLLILGSGCSAQPEPGQDQAASGGTLVATFRSEPTTYNRLTTAKAADEVLRLLTHDALVRVNRSTGEVEPRLAESWTVAPDGLSVRISLRRGVRFSDGAPLTSADVLFTFRALYDPRVESDVVGSYLVAGKPIRAAADGDLVVVLTFPAPVGRGLEILASLPILPRHKLEASLDAGTFRQAWGLTTPLSEVVGLGPFVLTEHRAGDRLRFERNPHFWRKDATGQALPYLSAIELAIVPEQNAEMLRLEAGQSDLTNDAVRAEDLSAFEALSKQGKLRLIDAGVSVDPDGLWFNLSPNAPGAKDRPYLGRPEFRRAVSLAANREDMVNTVYLSRAVPIGGPVTAGHGDWFLPELTPRRDLAAAAALLTGIGLVDRDGNGTLDDAAGRAVRFSLLSHKGHATRERMASVIKAQLAGIGITVDVSLVEPGAIAARYGARDFDTIYFGFASDTADPSASVDYWLSSGGYHVWNPGQAQAATAWEAEVDILMHRVATTVDQAERRRMFADVQRRFNEQLPVVYFVARKVTVATSGRVRGVMASVLSPPVLWNAEELSLVALSSRSPLP